MPPAMWNIGRLSVLAASLLLGLAFHNYASAASILPPGKTCFYDSNGNPVGGGTAGMYIPSTMTPKTTWQDSAQSILNIDPVPLDSAGCALIYGTGIYRQIVKDSLGNTIWDALTADPSGGLQNWGGVSGGTPNAQTVIAGGFSSQSGQIIWFKAGFTNGGPTTLTVSGGSPIGLLKDTPAGPIPLDGGEIVANNIVGVLYDAGLGKFHLITASGGATGTLVFRPPGGRLTLTSGVPIMQNDVASTGTVYYTPYFGNSIEVWDGSVLIPYVFTEITQNYDSNAAHTNYQAANNNFDEFIISDSSTSPATLRLCTGPAWATQTVRSAVVAYTAQGYLANQSSMICRWGTGANDFINVGANQATFVGTVRTFANGLTKMVMNPAPASGGTPAQLLVFNEYNRVLTQANVQDNGAPYTYASATVRPARNSTSNSINFVMGDISDGIHIVYQTTVSTGATIGDGATMGICLDVTNAYTNGTYQVVYTNANAVQTISLERSQVIPSVFGLHTLTACEGSAVGTSTYDTQSLAILIVGAMM